MTSRDVSRRDALRALGAAAALAALGDLAACSSSARHGSKTSPGASPAPVPHGNVVDGLRAFTGNWYGVGATASDNWTVSPLSAVLAFGMLRAGTRTSSASAIDAAFGFGTSADPAGSVHTELHRITEQVLTAPKQPSGSPPAPVLSIANGVFLDQHFAPHVQQAFLNLVHAEYGTQVQELDMSEPGAVDAINNWAAQQTHGLIQRVLNRLDSTTILALADAVYLKAAWATQFDAKQTVTGMFHTPSGATSVPLMHHDFAELGYAAGDGWQRVDLPYVSSNLTMRIVVPTRTLTTTDQLRPMLATAMSTIVKAGAEKVTLTLPKWRTTTTSELKAVMGALGAGVLFTDSADLSGIATRPLKVDQAIQKALISVDEKGTEAAAVTVLTLVPTSLTAGEPRVVTADRPFAWAIVHEPTGTPLFAGHVVNPAG